VLEGFEAFCAQPHIASQIARWRAEAPAQETAPLDSHPSIKDRLAALAALPPDERAIDETPAREMIADRTRAEREVFAARVAALRLGPLEPVAWAEVGMLVHAPRWRALAVEQRVALGALVVGELPAPAAAVAVARLLVLPKGFPRERQAYVTARLLMAALGTALVSAGWRVEAAPGMPVVARHGQRVVAPEQVVEQLFKGTLSADEWARQAADLGIAALPLAPHAGA
jgi:hypothetical protein